MDGNLNQCPEPKIHQVKLLAFQQNPYSLNVRSLVLSKKWDQVPSSQWQPLQTPERKKEGGNLETMSKVYLQFVLLITSNAVHMIQN